jgi:hypothetical protein
MTNVGGGQANRSRKAAALLAALLTVDGAGSGLDADLLDGTDWRAPGAIGGVTPGSAAFTTVAASGQITSTVTTGTAPLVVASTTAVANLNASLLLGNTWASPGAIGGTTPGSAAHTTISASGQITSTVTTGTAPLVIASTTVVANLNASLLLGSTWAAPGSIGSGTPAAGAFTTLSASSTLGVTGVSSFTNTTDASALGTAAVVLSGGLSVAKAMYIGGNINIASIGSGNSAQVLSVFGNLIRHRAYGYSTSYTAVQVSDSSRGIGFGIDPNTIAGGQFTGDGTDFFFSRNVAFGCPNAGATDWAWALKIAGGAATKAAPMVVIDDTGLTMATAALLIAAATSTTGASIRLPHGTAPTSPVNGDVWTTTAGLFVRINGVTKTVTLT